MQVGIRLQKALLQYAGGGSDVAVVDVAVVLLLGADTEMARAVCRERRIGIALSAARN